MGALLFDSLEIRNFRLFRHLQIERLGRVNLLVGRNNTGKTAVLEALRLYAAQGRPDVMLELIQARHEDRYPAVSDEDEWEHFLTVRNLFHQRKDYTQQPPPIQIGSATTQNDWLTIKWTKLARQVHQGAYQIFVPASPDQEETPEPPYVGFIIRLEEQEQLITPDTNIRWFRDVWFHEKREQKHLYAFVPAPGLGNFESARLWSNIAATDLEEDVIKALCIIEPNIAVFRFVHVREPDGTVIHTPIVRLQGSKDPIPLRSLGEGINRMLGIALALVNARNGLLLVDEIESGLHYSVQDDMWRLVFETARRLNVQVFATTHSWDCVESFQRAAQEDDHAEGMLVSLRRERDDSGDVNPVLFDERRLGIAAREQIEVR